MARVVAGRRSNTQFEELDAPATDVVRVEGRVSRIAGPRPGDPFVSDGWLADPTPAIGTDGLGISWSMATSTPFESITPASRIVITAVAGLLIIGLVLGDDGPWIIVVPGLTAVCGTWLDRRIRFSFAEGFIGYGGDPESGRGPFEDDWPAPRRGSAPAAP